MEVHAVAAMSSALNPSGKEKARLIEEAMSRAVLEACEDGLSLATDSDAIRARMLAARQAVIDQLNAPPEPVKE